MGGSWVRLAVEVATVANAFANASKWWYIQTKGHLDQNRSHRLFEVNVLMRIDVSRVLSYQPAESLQLPGHFLRHDACIVRSDNLVDGNPGVVSIRPLSQIQMQSQAEVRLLFGAYVAAPEASGQRTMRLALVTMPS